MVQLPHSCGAIAPQLWGNGNLPRTYNRRHKKGHQNAVGGWLHARFGQKLLQFVVGHGMWDVRRSGSIIIIGGCYGLYAFDLFLQMSFLFLSPRFPLPHSCGAIASQLWCNCPTIVVQLPHSCGATEKFLGKTKRRGKKTVSAASLPLVPTKTAG